MCGAPCGGVALLAFFPAWSPRCGGARPALPAFSWFPVTSTVPARGTRAVRPPRAPRARAGGPSASLLATECGRPAPSIADPAGMTPIPAPALQAAEFCGPRGRAFIYPGRPRAKGVWKMGRELTLHPCGHGAAKGTPNLEPTPTLRGGASSPHFTDRETEAQAKCCSQGHAPH